MEPTTYKTNEYLPTRLGWKKTEPNIDDEMAKGYFSSSSDAIQLAILKIFNSFISMMEEYSLSSFSNILDCDNLNCMLRRCKNLSTYLVVIGEYRSTSFTREVEKCYSGDNTRISSALVYCEYTYSPRSA